MRKDSAFYIAASLLLWPYNTHSKYGKSLSQAVTMATNRQEWSISSSWAALDHQMWLARDYYNILFFFWTKYYKLGLWVLVLSVQFSGFCSYWIMHFSWGGRAYYAASRRGFHWHHMICHIIRLQCFLFAVTAKVLKRHPQYCSAAVT